MPGPLPKPDRRRRNAPTIPTTKLLATGRRGRAPAVPAAYKLKKAGRDWWKWAWKLPQAMAWDSGALYVIARRAQLEDDLAVLEEADHLDLEELLGIEADHEAINRVELVIRRLKSLAGGRVAIMKEMRELDNRLGLNPKGLADLRWTIVAGEEEKQPRRRAASRRRLTLVDPEVAAKG